MKVVTAGTPGKPQHITPANQETREECFQRHYSRCVYKVGDEVAFKKPKRNRIRGRIDYIETDIKKMFWSDGGQQPRYIRVAVEYTDHEGKPQIGHMWACESKLVMGDIRK